MHKAFLNTSKTILMKDEEKTTLFIALLSLFFGFQV